MTDKTPDGTNENPTDENPTDDVAAAETEPANRAANRYEEVMVAAREARRINERVAMSRIEPKEKITTEAIRRTGRGDVSFGYRKHEEPDEAQESDFLSGDSEL